MLSLEVNEKEQAPLGQRIRAVGMCFYKKGDLKKGNNYQLRRNRDNPKDTNCFEVRSRHITMATINMNFSRLLAPFVGENIIWELTCLVVEDAKWSRGDSGRPARAHKVHVVFNVNERDAERVEKAFSDFEVRRSEA
ncbi:unnamed protein product [Porites evermanni]|uniref:Uncharacterized protein n=1 Tax=Porites evermanni TaxID=104178 RepID=A0ABN8QJN6_9CNID|nr:unnamed protein product [Porites evermanni]